MFGKKTDHEASAVAGSAWHTARQAAAQVKPAAAHAKPLARSTAAATKRGVHRTRAWAAPQVERTGQVLEDSVAPKVSAVLSAAARRLEPAKPRRRRWRNLVGLSMLGAAASAVAVLARNRRRPNFVTTAAQVDADTATPAAAMADEQARANADANGPARIS